MESVQLALEWADRAIGAVLLPLAVLILLSGLDDLAICAAFLEAKLRRRLPIPPKAAELDGLPERRIAIFVPLWHEEAVIGGMLAHNLAAVKYSSFDFFVGAYPNDAGTIRAVRAAAARWPRVHLALCPHDGPTSKADCLNWIYQRMLLFESEHGVTFDVVMTHDAEDLIHPDELRLVNHYADSYDMIQVPVLPLPTPLRQWTHGLYCDDFAEFHIKDLPARWRLGGFIPSSGVGTAFSRSSLEALAASDSNMIFRPDCLTEDYENGYRIRRLGLRQLFLPVRPAGAGQPPVATRGYFPKRFDAARRQRTRWITGIALQGWARNGWGDTWSEAYWFWRDRKGLVGNPLGLLANAIFFYGILTWLIALATGGTWGLAAHVGEAATILVPATAVVGGALAAARAGCSATVYGWRFAVWSPIRSLRGNLLNSIASAGALNRFARSVWFGQPLVWLKTEHAYPNLAALDSYKQPLETILAGTGAIAPQILEEARKTVGLGSLAEHLLALELVTEEVLLEALMLRHSLSGGAVPPNEVKARIVRLLPAEVAAAARVVPVSLLRGVLRLACPDLPGETALDRLRIQTRLPIEFHLVTRTNFAELKQLAA